jgi:hypothetical protein
MWHWFIYYEVSFSNWAVKSSLHSILKLWFFGDCRESSEIFKSFSCPKFHAILIYWKFCDAYEFLLFIFYLSSTAIANPKSKGSMNTVNPDKASVLWILLRLMWIQTWLLLIQIALLLILVCLAAVLLIQGWTVASIVTTVNPILPLIIPEWLL